MQKGWADRVVRLYRVHTKIRRRATGIGLYANSENPHKKTEPQATLAVRLSVSKKSFRHAGPSFLKVSTDPQA